MYIIEPCLELLHLGVDGEVEETEGTLEMLGSPVRVGLPLVGLQPVQDVPRPPFSTLIG